MLHGGRSTSRSGSRVLPAALALLASGLSLTLVTGAGAHSKITTIDGCSTYHANPQGLNTRSGNIVTVIGANCATGGTTGPTGPGGPGGNGGNGGNGSNGSSGSNGSNGASGVVLPGSAAAKQLVKGSTSKGRRPLACTSRRRFVIHIRHPRGQRIVSAIVTVNGKRARTARTNRVTSAITLVGLPRGTSRVHIVAVTNAGKVLRGTRTYHTCVPRRKHGVPKL